MMPRTILDPEFEKVVNRAIALAALVTCGTIVAAALKIGETLSLL